MLPSISPLFVFSSYLFWRVRLRTLGRLGRLDRLGRLGRLGRLDRLDRFNGKESQGGAARQQ